jgi:cysteine desulfurase / selenocysteine lyase
MSLPAVTERNEYLDAAGRLRAERVRADFPILARHINGRPLSYLDSGASAQQPKQVLEAVAYYATHQHANVHRGIHTLSQVATSVFEGARETVRAYLNARSTREIIFVRGTTEAINLVAASYGRGAIGPGDEVLISQLEHHANIVPWQLLCAERGARLIALPLTPEGQVDAQEFRRHLNARTRMVALAHVSNVLGTVLPVQELTAMAHQHGVPVLLDGAQAIAHEAIDVQALGCDFYAFSGHKMYAPTGIGVLYGREALLKAMPPWQSGGDMILTVSIQGSTWNELPYKFEAGTPNISGAVGLAAAFDYIRGLGRAAIAAHEHELAAHASEVLQRIPGLKLIGTAPGKAAVISFTLEGVHPHDIGTILDHEGVAIRTGHHCAMPLMDYLGLPATARASFACYNTHADVEALERALQRVREVFG